MFQQKVDSIIENVAAIKNGFNGNQYFFNNPLQVMTVHKTLVRMFENGESVRIGMLNHKAELVSFGTGSVGQMYLK